MAKIFSHPVYSSTGSWTTTGYVLYKSTAIGNTTGSAVAAPGSQVVTPASMANIVVGSVLDCDNGASYEKVTVTAVTSTTFTATFVNTHLINFVIQSSALAPNYYGPWTILQNGYTSNLDIYDPAGCRYDLYRVAPIVTIGSNTSIHLEPSRPFFPDETLYDSQMSALIDNLRGNYLDDTPIPQTDSTVTTEATGSGTLPFITDANTSRFYLSFLPNEKPMKFIVEDAKVFSGATQATASALAPFVDFFPNSEGGYIDFKTNPSLNSYLKVDYKMVRYTNDQCRNALANSVSQLSHYGINNYQLNQSNNLLYLAQPIPNRDYAEILCMIGAKNILSSKASSAFEASEAFKDGRVEWTADPARSIQAIAGRLTGLEAELRARTASLIVQNRVYPYSGEFDSFFSTTGSLPVYAMFFTQYAQFSSWI